MKELKEKAQALIDKYSPELADKGLKILLSKRYFESEVGERTGSHGVGAIFDSIDRTRDRNKENKRYFYERNKYHVFVITVVPCDKAILPKEFCRDYAFVLKKVTRVHIGEEPQRIAYEEEKILSKIEERILKILKKAERMSTQRICKDTMLDAIRYSMRAKYGYKNRFLGKSHFAWDFIIGIAIAVFCLIFILFCWIFN